MSKKGIKRVVSRVSVQDREKAARMTLEFQRTALAESRIAGTPNATRRIQLAISSAAGAVRTAESRRVRAALGCRAPGSHLE